MVKVFVPATTANLGPGFDTLGLALNLYNRFTITPCGQDKLTASPESTLPLEAVSRNPQENLIFKAMDRTYAQQNQTRPPFCVEIEAHIPLGRGLGSSSSAIVAGLTAANHFLENPLSKTTLCELATEIEGHPDNVAPAFYGGMTLCDDFSIYPLCWPTAWKIAVVVPHHILLTHQARQVLPPTYPLKDAIFNLRKSSLLVYSVLQQDRQAFSQALSDQLHQPYRAGLIPHFEPIKSLCLAHGALGAVISGAGPSVAVFYEEITENTLLPALEGFCKTQPDPYDILQLSPDLEGARIIA